MKSLREPIGETQQILQQRNSTYGNFLDQSAISCCLKADMRDTPNWDKLDADQKEALEMIAVKIARILNGDPNFHDSWKDIEGYSKLVADRLQGSSL